MNKLLFQNRLININTPQTTSILRTIEDYKREYTFNVQFDKYEVSTPIDTKAIFIKGDKNTSILKANLLKNNLPINLTGFTVTVNIKEGENDTITLPCTIVSASEGLIEINLNSSVVDEYGENTFEISIQKGNNVLVSQLYKYTVLDSLGEGEIGSETQLTTLQALILQVQEKINSVNSIVEELEVTQSDIDDILEMVGGL